MGILGALGHDLRHAVVIAIVAGIYVDTMIHQVVVYAQQVVCGNGTMLRMLGWLK